MNNSPFNTSDSPTQSHYGAFPSRDSQSLDVAHHFDQIEKQFVDLHDRLGQPTSQSQSRPTTHLTAPKIQTGRHIDLMDALNSPDRPHTTTPESLSPPVSPFNEDVAERNMTRFLRIQYQKGYSNSRILSALYQEDVADRNIAKYSAPERTMSGLSCRSSPTAPGRVRIPEGQKRLSKKREPGKPTWTSAENLRTNPSKDDGAGTATLRPQPDLKTALRPQRSAPSLGVDEAFVAQDVPPSPVQRLGVPPAYKLGKRWSNTPLPDSPTIPLMGDNSGAAEAPSIPRPLSSVSGKSCLTKRSHTPQPSSPSSSKRNARGLSINTQLAANGRSKITHRAIQPPTPSTSNMKRTPSIAEVMNSPLPVSSCASSPKSSAQMKPSELVDLFTKAYMSSQGPIPTYETLHDAIVREVNSHEAFKRVPVPVPGPPFTPAADKNSNDSEQATGLNRSSSTKSRLNKSFMKHKRTPESRRSISNSVGYDRLMRKVAGSPARRRHTDAPLPSPGFLVDVPSKRPEVAPLPTGEPLTYMDVLRASNENLPASNASCAAPNVSRKRGRSDSASNLAIPRPAPEISLPPKTVYCMQAHSTPANMGSLDDDDDDIIHLPSLGMPPPRVQIEGVDENNIRYVIDAASPDDAHRLMYWPQRIRGGVGSTAFGSSLSPLSRSRMQLRNSRSVETY